MDSMGLKLNHFVILVYARVYNLLIIWSMEMIEMSTAMNKYVRGLGTFYQELSACLTISYLI